MNLDLDASFFSRRESHWSIFTDGAGSPADGISPQLESLTLRYIFAGSTDVYDLSLGAGSEHIPFRYEATASKLTLFPVSDGEAPGASSEYVEIILPAPDEMRLRTTGVTCRLSVSSASRGQWEAVLPRHDGDGERRSWRMVVKAVKHDLDVLAGEVSTPARWRPKASGDRRHQYSEQFEFIVEPGSDLLMRDYQSEAGESGPLRPFDHVERQVAAEFDAFAAAGPPVEEQYHDVAEQAAYLCWASIVPAWGNFTEPSMLMSKRWMTNTWNWDNYFNAWGLSLRDPELAWRIYQLHFTHQNADGALADGINEQKIGWIYTKPPVHGLVLSRLMESGVVTDARLAVIYPRLVRATEWWFRHRDDDGDLICQYHHGNDSGWDDATVFDLEPPIESPDLTALLVVQLHVLSRVARRLGRESEARDHAARAEELLSALLEHSVRDGRFVALKDSTHEEAPTDSLLLRIPMILGSLLPHEIADALADDLADEERFLGAHGLATEAMTSDEFLPDGYWRGPGWAPALMLIVWGLIDAGRVELAQTIARRFCDTCAVSGFAECFNVQTGAPLHDRGYTWTASVFTILSHWLYQAQNGGGA